MVLTNENYYSNIANLEYMSVSQYKSFCECEAATMAQLHGEWERPSTTAQLVGSYIDSWFEGTLEEFCIKNKDSIYTQASLRKQKALFDIHPEAENETPLRGLVLLEDFKKADGIIEFLQKDPTFMRYMSGKKQVIITFELFGCLWKAKIDSNHPDKIVDLKITKSMDRVMGKSFVEYWGYDTQMAAYAAGRGDDPCTYLAVATKQNPPAKAIISVPKWRREECLNEIKRNMPRILSVKSGKVPPRRCERCEYCRATHMITEPIDFEMVGLSPAERGAIFGL